MAHTISGHATMRDAVNALISGNFSEAESVLSDACSSVNLERTPLTHELARMYFLLAYVVEQQGRDASSLKELAQYVKDQARLKETLF